MSDAAQWKFRVMSKGEELVDPVHGEFFSTDIVGGLPMALVRETIQNSLDAKPKNSSVPVRVAFRFGTHAVSHIPAADCESYLQGLRQHLVAKDCGLREVPPEESAVPYLVIEDFGTTGLEGDPAEDDIEGGDDNAHNYFYFWRNIARSGKGEDDRGRWGLGKSVFPASSRINSFFGLTVRASDGRRLLAGQAVLKIHRDDVGARCAPYGKFGLFTDAVNPDFGTPAEDLGHLDGFCELFGLQRGAESGLSIVIPFPDQELTHNEILLAVIEQYFHPVLAGDLIVQVETADGMLTIDHGSIDAALDHIDFSAQKVDRQQLERRLEFVRWILAQDGDVCIEPAKAARLLAAPNWKKVSFADDVIAEARSRFSDGGRIAFRIPTKVQRVGQAPVPGQFCAYLERDPSLEGYESHYIREGIKIIGVEPRLPQGMRGVVLIEPGPLASMLGDAENPAHTEWHKDSPKFKGRYEHAPSCLNFVRDTLSRLVRELSPPAGTVDKELLKDLFFLAMEEQTDSNTPSRKKKKGKDSTEGQDTPPPPPTPMLQVAQIPGGLTIRRHPRAKRRPETVRVKLGYIVRRGNPFRKYNPADFELDKNPITLDTDGVDVTVREQNILEFDIRDEDFSVQIAGFDPNRDLKVRVDPIGAPS